MHEHPCLVEVMAWARSRWEERAVPARRPFNVPVTVTVQNDEGRAVDLTTISVSVMASLSVDGGLRIRYQGASVPPRLAAAVPYVKIGSFTKHE